MLVFRYETPDVYWQEFRHERDLQTAVNDYVNDNTNHNITKELFKKVLLQT